MPAAETMRIERKQKLKESLAMRLENRAMETNGNERKRGTARGLESRSSERASADRGGDVLPYPITTACEIIFSNTAVSFRLKNSELWR